MIYDCRFSTFDRGSCRTSLRFLTDHTCLLHRLPAGVLGTLLITCPTPTPHAPLRRRTLLRRYTAARGHRPWRLRILCVPWLCFGRFTATHGGRALRHATQIMVILCGTNVSIRTTTTGLTQGDVGSRSVGRQAYACWRLKRHIATRGGISSCGRDGLDARWRKTLANIHLLRYGARRDASFQIISTRCRSLAAACGSNVMRYAAFGRGVSFAVFKHWYRRARTFQRAYGTPRHLARPHAAPNTATGLGDRGCLQDVHRRGFERHGCCDYLQWHDITVTDGSTGI